jgi:hypothetical protein
VKAFACLKSKLQTAVSARRLNFTGMLTRVIVYKNKNKADSGSMEFQTADCCALISKQLPPRFPVNIFYTQKYTALCTIMLYFSVLVQMREVDEIPY